MTSSSGFSVRIFMPSGEPEGLRVVEKSNWSGQGLVFPRSLYGAERKRPELTRTGVYILWGPGESGELPRVYVGEGDVLLPRLDSHMRHKDFWTHAALFTSKDQNLNKAHVQHLEARLVARAAEARRCRLENGNVPQVPSLSEADAADAEGYLTNLLLCLPLVGARFFESPEVSETEAVALFLRAKGIEARGFDGAEGFVVRAGSQAVKDEAASIHAYLGNLRRTLLQNGVLEDAGATFRLTQDYSFDSPSSAAGVLLGRSANGRSEWKDAAGRSLKELQEAEVATG